MKKTVKLDSVSPEGLRARAQLVRERQSNSESTARHLELAADEIEQLRYSSVLVQCFAACFFLVGCWLIFVW